MTLFLNNWTKLPVVNLDEKDESQINKPRDEISDITTYIKEIKIIKYYFEQLYFLKNLEHL